MKIYQAIILGIVQGLTELLPISSSAHLNLMPWIFNWTMSDSFDIALHLGTLLAITIFFFKDWLGLIKGGYEQVVKKKKSTEGKIFWYIVAVTIPTGIVSLVLDEFSEFICQDPKVEKLLIAAALIILGIVLYIVDKKSASETKYEDMTFKQSFLIGISQAIAAAFPGTSRSGITMTVARALKVDRESAAKYSFLLSTPIILAAVLVSITSFELSPAFWAGLISSFMVGMIVIKFLLNYLKKGNFKVFAIYRVVLGIIVIALTFMR